MDRDEELFYGIGVNARVPGYAARGVDRIVRPSFAERAHRRLEDPRGMVTP